ncbi:MAG: tetratricopeptide repeat protein, partial [Pseudomonadota bacterium]
MFTAAIAATLLVAPPGQDSTALDQSERASPASSDSITLSPRQLFELASRLVVEERYDDAEQAYRALATNPDIEIRTEARFRHGMMLADRLQRFTEAAVLFRQILDEKPDAARVRIELARMQLLLGNLRSAEREFRAASAGGLPPEVEQLVR